jgi:hypothetical protein
MRDGRFRLRELTPRAGAGAEITFGGDETCGFAVPDPTYLTYRLEAARNDTEKWRNPRINGPCDRAGGVCCQFIAAPIRFRTTTAAACTLLPREGQLAKIGLLCQLNAAAFEAALEFCAGCRFGCFRVNSRIPPVKTHPTVGYRVDELPAESIGAAFRRCGALWEAFRRFPWRRSAAHLKRWQRGQTGYPIVDAAMRQLWATGFMPNRARMIVASFLAKDLRLKWQEGADWFWDTLVDADLANNTLNWQWSAGCGADAAPYFRVFNPVSQAEQFDPKGEYIRRWVPELAGLPTPWIFNPWAAPNNVLADVRVRLGKSYPRPIVDHAQAREAALAAFAKIRGG